MIGNTILHHQTSPTSQPSTIVTCYESEPRLSVLENQSAKMDILVNLGVPQGGLMKRPVQTQAPMPDPEIKKLHAWVGRWTAHAKIKAGPFGPGGKNNIEYTGQMILGGFFFQGRWRDKGFRGEGRGFHIDAYNPVNKDFTSSWFMDDGSTFSGSLTISGDTYTYEGHLVVAGKSSLLRDIFVLAPDRMSMKVRAESSVDGKTWTPLSEGKYIKIKPTPKK